MTNERPVMQSDVDALPRVGRLTEEEVSRSRIFDSSDIESARREAFTGEEVTSLASKREEAGTWVEEYNATAHRLEEWAGILHDHPVSEAYKAAHPLFEITPQILLNMEDFSITDSDKADRYEEESKEIAGFDVLSGLVGEDSTGLESLLNELRVLRDDGMQYTDRWNKLKDSRDTTLGEIADFYREVLQEAKVKPLRNRVNATRSILDEIRSGRASEELPKTELAPA